MSVYRARTPALRAIETRFKGYRFRSRLEARWALFFDTLGLRWEYEPEGFRMPDGTFYLPDFRVYTPQGEIIWYEIKPFHPDDFLTSKFVTFWTALTAPHDARESAIKAWREIEFKGLSGDSLRQRWRELETDCPGVALPRANMLCGDPLTLFGNKDTAMCPRCGVISVVGDLGDWSDTEFNGWSCCCESCEFELPKIVSSGSSYLLPIEYDGVLGTPYQSSNIGNSIFDPAEKSFASFRKAVFAAAQRARSARFEHGQTPA